MKNANVKVEKAADTTDRMKPRTPPATFAAMVLSAAGLRLSRAITLCASRLAPNRRLAQSTTSLARAGTPWTNWAIWSPSSRPKITRKSAHAAMKATMTIIAATPRRIRSDSLATAGSMATLARNDRISVKMTLPPSARTHRATRARATTPTTTQPARHTVRGSRTTRTSIGATGRSRVLSFSAGSGTLMGQQWHTGPPLAGEGPGRFRGRGQGCAGGLSPRPQKR